MDSIGEHQSRGPLLRGDHTGRRGRLDHLLQQQLNSDVANGDEKLVRLFEYTLPTPSSPPKLVRTVRMDGFDDVEGLALVEKTSTGVRLVVTEEGRLNLVLITLALPSHLSLSFLACDGSHLA